MFDKSLQEALHHATLFTRKLKNEFVSLEHFLHSSFKVQSFKDFSLELGVNIQTESDQIEAYILKNHPIIPKLSSHYNPEPTLALHRCIEQALQQAQGAGKKSISLFHVLISAFNEEDSFAVYRMEKMGLTPLVLMEHLSDQSEDGSDASSSQDPLKKFCEDLNLKVEQNRHNPLIGRQAELDRVLEVLARKTKNNPLLVGDPGVGKTSLGEGLAELAVNKKLPSKFEELKVFNLDLASLLAGSKYRGDFEARFKSLLKSLKTFKNPLLFIDEIQSIVGAGSTNGSSVDFASLLKPYLSDSSIKIIGTTTYEDFRKHFAKDAALSRRFQAVFIEEPSQADCLEILKGLQKNYEDFHSVKIDESALKESIALAAKYIPERKFPDKAFDVLDETCAHESTLKNNFVVTKKEIQATLQRVYNVQETQTSSSSKDLVTELSQKLKNVIYGQDQAVEDLQEALLVAYSGLKSQHKPIGSFLFTGPTGVGKTELSLQLSKALNVPFVKFDMSEYMEKHSVSRLIGSPPGYVGHEEGGRLTDEVSKHPHAVLLLDEIEKAHPDVINILLQVMDSGVLTDAIGKTTYFNNCILIMTSNSGAREAIKGSIGVFKAPTSDFSEKALKNFFSPEFLNRITSIVKFEDLKEKHLNKVVEKNLENIKKNLSKQGLELTWSEEVVSFITKDAKEENMGARPFERYVDKKVKTLLAAEIMKPSSKVKKTLSIVLKKSQIALL